jgi:tetratricopeptide (TPR) repeat protein
MVEPLSMTDQRPGQPISQVSPNAPNPDEVRDALARIVFSGEMRASPQLMAFLRFVVETAQRGEAGRIKAYTIAVEALGRPAEFNPDGDSIVRVEAGRLRRLLQAYYSSAGADDPIVIEMPRGSYVPAFRRRVAMQQAEPSIELPRDAIPAVTSAPVARRPWLALTMLAVVAVMALAVGGPRTGVQGVSSAPASTGKQAARPHAALRPAPVVYFQPFDVIGTPSNGAFTVERLLSKLADATARFDGINVVLAGEHAPLADAAHDWNEYRMGGSVGYHSDGTVALDFRLVDATNGTVYWSRQFDRLRFDSDPASVENAVVREVAAALAGPFGVVWARELNAQYAPDARRACIIELIEYWRKFDPALHARVRQCTARMAAIDPTDISAFNGIALISLREFWLDIPRPDEPPALDRALQAALQAVKVKPDSARAYHILFVIWFARGDLDQAWRTAEKALALNPYDTSIIGEYGARLVAAGQIERGRALLEDAAAADVVRPIAFDFGRFLAAYLMDDRGTATRYAAMIEGDPSVYGLLARALAAQMTGDADKARLAVDRLLRLNATWGTDPQRQLTKFFPAAAVRNRLLADLEAAGLRASD